MQLLSLLQPLLPSSLPSLLYLLLLHQVPRSLLPSSLLSLSLLPIILQPSFLARPLPSHLSPLLFAPLPFPPLPPQLAATSYCCLLFSLLPPTLLPSTILYPLPRWPWAACTRPQSCMNMQNCVTPLPTPFTLQILVVLVDDSPLGAHVFLFSILRFLFFSQISLAFFMWKFRLAYLRSWPNFAVFYYFVFPRRTKKNRNEGSKRISILSNLSLCGGVDSSRRFSHTRFSRISARYAMRSDWLIDARLNAWLSPRSIVLIFAEFDFGNTTLNISW